MKEFSQKERPRISLDPLIQKIDAYSPTDSYPGGRHDPKSVKTTDNIAVRAGLHLQSERSYASC